MKLEEKKYLLDVLLAINDLHEILGNEKKFENFIASIALIRASERQFEIIGEAIRKLKALNPNLEITHSKEIINLRNRIAHAYDSIDYEQLWGIIVNHIPQLKSEIEALLNN